MSIKVYSGRPRHGKSYNAVSNVIIPAIKSGRTVVTNVVLKKDIILSDYPDANIITIPFNLNHEQAKSYINSSFYPAGSVYVLDEGAKLFPTGLKVTNIPDHMLLFFSEHGHSVGPQGYASEIFILCQENSQLAKFIRDLVDTTYHHVKLDKHGLKNNFRVDIYDGSINAASYRGKPLESKTGSYKPDIYKYYKSHTQKDDLADTALEESPDKRGSHMHVYYYAIISVPVFFALAYFAFSSLMSLFSSGADEQELQDKKQPLEISPASPVSTIPSSSPPVTKKGRNDSLSLSSDWRLSGVINASDRVYIIIDSQDRSRRLDALKHCDYDSDISEWFCILNGDVIASYTGPVWNPDESDNDLLPFSD